jgi:prolyl-tRNA synthetase
MRISNLFGQTLRSVSAEVEQKGHEYLLRGAFVRRLGSGIFSYLHLGQRSVKKIEQILRDEMEGIGAQEISMPVVHPAEIWKQTNRFERMDASLLRFKDRNDADMVLAMTHEEVVTDLARQEIKSHKQLPKLVYQIQTKFRDELRSRGGLIRVREFTMKDSYSFDKDDAGLQAIYQKHYDAYLRIGARVDLPIVATESDSGMMGGAKAHEFMYLNAIGEDTIVQCDTCEYIANKEVAKGSSEAHNTENQEALEEVHTPATKTIAQLAAFMNADKRDLAKAVLLYSASADKAVIAVVRGDCDVNMQEVQVLTKLTDLEAATDSQSKAAGIEPGYASPIGIDREKSIVVVDELVTATSNMVAGANKRDHHLKNVNYGRDYEADLVGHIHQATEGDSCTTCSNALTFVRGVEVGNIFQLGTRYSEALGANFTDSDGKDKPLVMGSYGIGVGRLMACIAEHHQDEKGLVWPVSVAPYHVNLITLTKKEEALAAADQLYDTFKKAGIEVLYDDRNDGLGSKFKDAELRGIPIIIAVTPRSLENGGAEFKVRRTGSEAIVSLDSLVDEIGKTLRALNEL